MERRRYVRTVAAFGVGTALAGCSGAGDDDEPEETATPLETDAETVAEPTPTAEPRTGTVPEAAVAAAAVDWERRRYDGAGVDADDPPRVDFDPAADRLYVRGVVLVGSSSCYEAAVHDVEYEDAELYVHVRPDWRESVRDETPGECTADVSADAYEVAVTFDDGLPERVVVEEDDATAERRRAVYER